MPLLDLHAHFPMHLRFPPRVSGDPVADDVKAIEFWAASLLLNSQCGRPRVTLELARRGGVGGFASALYDPDDEFFRGSQPRPEAFPNLLAQLDEVERELTGAGIAVARRPAAVEEALANGRLAVFHCVEGAHGLGGDPANVRLLARRGVAYITVAHLFYRGVATCPNPIPHLPESLYRVVDPQPEATGLTALGRQIVECMFEERVLADVTHCSAQALEDVFEIAARYPGRPLIFSHAGVRATSDYALNPSDDVIMRIARTGGVIGVILAQYWLHQPSEQICGPENLDLVLRAIDHIAALTGSFDAIAIGSDLDGFIVPVEDCANYGEAPALERALTARYGADNAARILWKNVVRVLHQGWAGAAN